MKRKLICLLLLSLLAGLAGCGQKTETTAKESDVYLSYLNAEEDQIEQVEYSFENPDPDARILELTVLQQNDPKAEDLHPLIPDGVTIQSCVLKDDTVSMDFSKEALNLDNARRTLMLGGLVRTYTQIDEVTGMKFTINGSPMVDSYGQEYGVLTRDCFAENAGRTINSYLYSTMTLYFTDETGSILLPETRKVYYSSNEPVERAVVEALIKGAEEAGHYPVLPKDTGILSVNTQNGICYVNFDKSVNNPILSIREEIPIYAIVNSLVDTCKVEKVQFTINGESKTVFRESMKLSVQYEKNKDLIGG